MVVVTSYRITGPPRENHGDVTIYKFVCARVYVCVATTIHEVRIYVNDV